MMSKIDIAVVGVGHLGQHHAKHLTTIDAVNLVAVVDTDEKRANALAEKFNTKAYTDYTKILDTVDAVSIAVPTGIHFEVARRFLEKGVHVLVEKPIAKTVNEAEKLVDLAKQKKCVLQVGHIERFNSAVFAASSVIHDPKFIESHRLAPFVARGTDVAVVLDLMIHDIDIILSFVQSDPVQIDAVGLPILTDSEDIANARLTFANGCVANVTASRVSKDPVRKIRFFQENAYISLDYHSRSVEVVKLSQEARQFLQNTSQNYGEVMKKIQTLNIDVNDYILRDELEVENFDPLRAELISFAECINNGTKPVVSGEDGLKALKVAFQILEKMKTHREQVSERDETLS
jgi:predicted dehydrogenase